MARRAWAGGATTCLRAASRAMYVGFPSSNGKRGGRRVVEAGGTKLAVNDATWKLELDLLAIWDNWKTTCRGVVTGDNSRAGKGRGMILRKLPEKANGTKFPPRSVVFFIGRRMGRRRCKRRRRGRREKRGNYGGRERRRRGRNRRGKEGRAGAPLTVHMVISTVNT